MGMNWLVINNTLLGSLPSFIVGGYHCYLDCELKLAAMLYCQRLPLVSISALWISHSEKFDYILSNLDFEPYFEVNQSITSVNIFLLSFTVGLLPPLSLEM